MKIYRQSLFAWLFLFCLLSVSTLSAKAVTITESKVYSVEEVDHVVQPFGSKLLAVKLEEKWGYMNSKGKMVIPAIFEDAHNFHEELASVKNNGKWGYIDTNGEFIVKAEYEEAAPAFHESYTQVAKKGKWGIINKRGKIIIPLKYAETCAVGEGLTPIKIGGKYGFMNMKGKMVIPAKYTHAYNFQNGLAPVKSKGKWGYINKSGKLIIPYKYIDVESFNKGYARVVLQKANNYFYGVINQKGKTVLEIKYNQILPLNNEVAPFFIQRSPGKMSMGYISLKTGKTLFQVKNSVNEFSEGYAFGTYNGKLLNVVYDAEGKKTFLKNKYYQASTFYNDYAVGSVDYGETKFRIIHKK
ncbi:WG repeat-containing protein [Rummeliibacillus suwonensis]|uniref:WG repeat-containing protein n=1 Tax=Rummeliibacillus suwonensis TaxID=1306154 RepID=UPI0011B691F9|nr:WG repeat-containing protein [Rummeliibacillus suwonensis]